MKTPKMMVTLLLAGCLVSPAIAQPPAGGTTGATQKRAEMECREFMRAVANDFKDLKRYDPRNQLVHPKNNVYYCGDAHIIKRLVERLNSTDPSATYPSIIEFGKGLDPDQAERFKNHIETVKKALEPLTQNAALAGKDFGNTTPTKATTTQSLNQYDAKLATAFGDDPAKAEAASTVEFYLHPAVYAMCQLRTACKLVAKSFGTKYASDASSGKGMSADEARLIKDAYVDHTGCK